MDLNEVITQGIRCIYNTDDFIPLSAPVFCGKEKEYLSECIDTTFVSSVGKFVDRFELDLASYMGVKKAVVCVNGTCALHTALMLCNVNRDDEVLTQALTFVATANAIAYTGAQPIFIDVDLDTLGMSPSSLKEWLENNTFIKNEECYNKKTSKRIKACVPMHTFGHPCKIDQIVDICTQYHIEVIEDAAESIGSLYKNRQCGTFGKIGTLSFNGNKTITTGGGGVLLFNDEELAKKAKHLTTQAKVPHQWEFVHDEVGFNYRMPNINAALGCAQLEYIDKLVESKRKVADKYKELFKNNEKVKFFIEPNNAKSNYWLNALLFNSKEDQQSFLKYTNDHGVMTRPTWRLMSNLPMYSKCQKDNLKNSQFLENCLVNIPSSPLFLGSVLK